MSGAEFNISEVKALRDRFRRLEKNMNNICETIVIDVALRVMRPTIRNTPRDTNTLIWGWVYEEEEEAMKAAAARGNPGAVFNAFEGRLTVTNDGKYYTVLITNPVHYSEYVEYGHRIVNGAGETVGWKNGAFMLTRSMMAVEKRLERIMAQTLDNLLKEELGL